MPDVSVVWLVGSAVVSGLLAFVGAMVGLVLGQFRLPLLLAALGSASMAVPSNLAISSLGAATGALAHAREGRVDLRLLLSIGVPSALAAFASSHLLDKVTKTWWIEALIGATLLVSAIPVIRRAGVEAQPVAIDVPLAMAPDRPVGSRLLLIEIAIGAGLGALSGVVGLLLGTLRLPAMLRLGVTPQRAAGTNMAIGFFTGVGGALGAVFSGLVSMSALVIVGSATLVGAWLGARRTKRLPTKAHLTLIAVVLVVVGTWLLVNALLGP